MKVIRTKQHGRYECEQIAEVFPPEFCRAAKWTEAGNYTPAGGEHAYVLDDETPAQAGWRVRDGAPIPPETEVIEDMKVDKLVEIAAARWAEETGGVSLNGMSLDTSRESQALITGAALQATIDNAYACRWKTAQGFAELSAQQIIGAAQAVRAHVQACFDREAELAAAAAAAETIEAVKEIRWDE
ncbi:hypothetical protein FACS1894216_02750 [Synergistales bacterium]|nr:hypothetical protein FACS1894216_02750 [Synergistales bacterium]